MKTLRELIEKNQQRLQLSWVAGFDGADRVIDLECFASSDLIGHLNVIHPARIQVFGHQEVEYYAMIDRPRRVHQTARMIAGRPPAIIIAEGFAPDQDVIEACNAHQIPLLTTPISAAQLIDFLRVFLNKWLAPICTMHGVFMDVLGMGVLIRGESGLGKSELGLELISRGHGLVADDVVEFARVAPNLIEGRCPDLLRNLLEVRGLGLLDIKTIFGETAVRRKMRLKLVVHLRRRASIELKQERLPMRAEFEQVLGLPIRTVTLPVAAGRNLAVLLEAAVRNTILQLRGIDTLADFVERQETAIRQNSIEPND